MGYNPPPQLATHSQLATQISFTFKVMIKGYEKWLVGRTRCPLILPDLTHVLWTNLIFQVFSQPSDGKIAGTTDMPLTFTEKMLS